jgi:hypothetical protein
VTSDTAWAELGIEATSELAQVRRAYARRLKSINADHDANAFMRLREAFETACEAARVLAEGSALDSNEATGDQPVTLVESEAESDWPPSPDWEDEALTSSQADPVTQANQDLPYYAFASFREDFNALAGAGISRAAAELLRTALAEGVVPLGQEKALVQQLAACAINDATLSLEELEGLCAAFGSAGMAGDRDEPMQIVRAEADALRWQERILHDARLGDVKLMGWALRLYMRRVRIAYAIRNPEFADLLTRDLAALRIEVTRARRYADVVSDRFDVPALEAKLANLEQNLRGHEFAAILIGMVVVPAIGAAESWTLAVVIGVVLLLHVIWAKWYA